MPAASSNRPLLRMEADRRPDHVVLSCSGEIDLSTVPLFENALSSWAQTGVPELIVDLREVVYLDSCAIEAVIKAHRHMSRNGESLRVRALPRAARLFHLLRLDGLLDKAANRVEEGCSQSRCECPPTRHRPALDPDLRGREERARRE